MNRRLGIGIVTAATAAVLLLVCGIGLVLPILGSSAIAACGQPAPPAAPSNAGGDWTAIQQQRAAMIVAVGQRKNISPRGWVIAVATAMQESRLRSLANTRVPSSTAYPHDGTGHDHDSLGLFQQRPSPPDGNGTWGTVAELMDPQTSAAKFYTALSKVAEWQQMRLTDAAQAVQHSAYPHAYQKWEQPAEALVSALIGVTDLGRIGGGAPPAPCGTGAVPPVVVGANGWTQPVRAPIVSPYGWRDGRLHAGVDLGAARDTPIRAAAAGIVIKVRCDSGIGTCDRDGGVHVSGCGWFIEVRHAVQIQYLGRTVTQVVTRYCHMARRPSVAVGQPIAAGDVVGFVGSSGHSSGPHLHFEVHPNVLPSRPVADNNSIDPVLWMRAAGAPIGQ